MRILRWAVTKMMDMCLGVSEEPNPRVGSLNGKGVHSEPSQGIPNSNIIPKEPRRMSGQTLLTALRNQKCSALVKGFWLPELETRDVFGVNPSVCDVLLPGSHGTSSFLLPWAGIHPSSLLHRLSIDLIIWSFLVLIKTKTCSMPYRSAFLFCWGDWRVVTWWSWYLHVAPLCPWVWNAHHTTSQFLDL